MNLIVAAEGSASRLTFDRSKPASVRGFEHIHAGRPPRATFSTGPALRDAVGASAAPATS